jgi:hypothetical protein
METSTILSTTQRNEERRDMMGLSALFAPLRWTFGAKFNYSHHFKINSDLSQICARSFSGMRAAMDERREETDELVGRSHRSHK